MGFKPENSSVRLEKLRVNQKELISNKIIAYKEIMLNF